MSSQSGSEYNSRKGNNKSKKTKAEPILQKRTRRSNRKIDQGEESENVLPSHIPITESEDLTIYHSLELELAKTIIQIPVLLFRKPKMQKQAQIRVGQSVLQVQISKNELGQLLVNAKIKSQTSVIKEQKKNGSNRQQAIEVQKQQQNGEINEKCNDQQSEDGEQCTYLVWGKACWIGAHQIVSKTIKQSPKILNSQIFLEIIKVKTKQVNSDIFLIVNTRKKIECVADHNGLINQGNTCYMNSYLQMLSHISQFKNLVFQASLVDQNKFPATLQLLFHKLDNQQKPVSAEQLVKSFGWSKKDTNIQQDAEQFSCLFYDALERKLQQACPNPKHMNMSEMFQGKLRNLIQCLDVGNRSLDDYVAEQELSGDNLYNTQFYGPQRAKKSVRFLSLPPIIMVQLKRFQFNYISNKNQKILHHFQYPDTIDFSRWQVSSEQQCLYELYAVLVHQGIKAESGHYYAYVKATDDWYRFNDQQVSRASKLQVFDYNFGGQIDVFEFDARQFKVYNRKTVCTSTAYMLVYVKQDLKQRLLNSEPIYPEWLQEHQIMKQGQRQQLRIRKNFYHDIQILEWETHFNNTIADFLGIIFKNFQQSVGKVIPKISKTDRVDEWVKPLNQKGIGSYLYLVSFEKTEYETLVNMQHRKCTFQDLIREPNCPIMMINMPLIAKVDSLLYFIKIASPQMKMSEDEQSEYELRIKFDQVLQINRNSKNSELTMRLREFYSESGYKLRFFYEEKKQLIEIKDDKSLIRGPQMQRNILGIIVVQKLPEQLENKMKNSTISWYNDLKNFVPIKIKSEDGKYEFDTEMDQNRSVQSLRQYIFHEKIQREDACSASDNIVLKAKLKKTAKNYVEVTNAQTIRDLIKNCDKQNIIVFSFSNLKADERKNQIEIKFMYRFPDFTFSEMFHVILDRKSQNQSQNIYQKIAQHDEVQNYKKIQQVQGIRIFLFSKDKNVINDIVFENGHVHGKGEIAQVLQKQKGSHLVVQGFPVPKIQQQICPILLHHRSQNDERIGTPRYLQFNRTILLTQIYNQIQEMIKDEEYEWEQKKIKCNIMKLFIYAYYKDYSKGIELVDQVRLEQEQKDRIKQCKRKQKQKLEMRQQIQVEGEGEGNKKQEEMCAKNQQKSNAMDVQQNVKKQCIIVIDDQDQQKNNQKIEIEKLLINNGNGEEEKGTDQNRKQSQTRKNSKCEPKVQAWQKTLDMAFPKVKLLKIVVKHTYLTKSQTVMKINVQ